MSPRPWRTWLPALAVFVLALAGVAAFSHLHAEHERAELEDHTRITAAQTALRLESYLRARLAVTESLHELLVADGAEQITQRHFAQRAGAIHSRFPGIQAINFIDTRRVFVWAVPEAPNRAVLGRRAAGKPAASRAFEAAVATGSLQVSAPLDLTQGGRGFVAYVPIESGSRTIGYLNVAFDARSVVRHSLRSGVLDRYQLRLREDQALLYQSPGWPSDNRFVTTTGFRVGQRAWQLELAPTSQLITASQTRDAALMPFGLLLALALGAGVFFAAARREQRQLGERRMQAFLSALPDLALRVDRHGQLLDYRGPDSMLGLVRPGVSPEERLPAELAAGIRRCLQRTDGERCRFELHDDVGDRDLEVRLVRADSGEALVLVRDVTANNERQRALRRLSAIVERSPDYIGMANQAGQMIYVNDAGRELLGVPDAGSIGSFEQYLDTRNNNHEELAKALASSGKWEGRLVLLNRQSQQSIPCHVHAFVIDDPDSGEPIGTAAIARDLRVQEELEGQLRQAQKMEAVGTLAGGIAHDFNNLMTAITAHAQVALEESSDTPLRDDLRAIMNASRSGTKLVSQLLTFSRHQAGTPEVFDLNTAIESLARLLLPLIRKDVVVEVDLDEQPCPVYADSGQIEQVVVNLVVNASQAMPSGGRIDIETRRRDDGVELRVRDDGEGMTAEVKERIFDPFFSTKPHGKGTGLGLSTVHGIVARHEGTIEVQSEPGRGSTFVVRLPRAALPLDGKSADPASQRVARVTGRVLVVEDNRMVRRAALRLLRKHGFAVLEASSGEEALAIFDERPNDIDVVLTDVVMPTMGGEELASQLRERSSRVGLVLTSGYSERHISDDRLVRLQASFLPKPYDRDVLLRHVSEAVLRSRVSSLPPPTALMQ